MKQSPAFQFYPNDFTGSGKVGTMTTEEVGMYMLLLCLDWNENGFVFDERRLARWCRLSLARFRRDWQAVAPCFTERDGRMFNPRLELERQKQAEWREKSSKGGKASAESRGKGGSRVVQPKGQPKGNTPSPSSKKDGKSNNDLKGSGAEAPPLQLVSHSWPVEGAATWQEMVGRMTPGKFGKLLKPAVDQHGWPKVRIALVRWIMEREAQGRPRRLEWFADEATAAVNAPDQPIVDEYGVLTAYGERITRPVKHA